MVDSVDYFVIKVSFEGTAVVVGRYCTFNDADEISSALSEVGVVEGVRVELWSNRIARRYGMPIERVRVEKLLAKLEDVRVRWKAREVSAEEAYKIERKVGRLLLEVLRNG